MSHTSKDAKIDEMNERQKEEVLAALDIPISLTITPLPAASERHIPNGRGKYVHPVKITVLDLYDTVFNLIKYLDLTLASYKTEPNSEILYPTTALEPIVVGGISKPFFSKREREGQFTIAVKPGALTGTYFVKVGVTLKAKDENDTQYAGPGTIFVQFNIP